MSGTPNLGEMISLELYGPGGGGLRVNNLEFDTSLDGQRHTLRSFWRDYAGVQLGSTTRKFSIKEWIDFESQGDGIDLEAAFLNGTFLRYRATMLGSGRRAEGTCHVVAPPKINSGDGKPTEMNAEFEGDPALFV